MRPRYGWRHLLFHDWSAWDSDGWGWPYYESRVCRLCGKRNVR